MTGFRFNGTWMRVCRRFFQVEVNDLRGHYVHKDIGDRPKDFTLLLQC